MKLLLIYPYSHVDSNPTITSLLEMLVKRNIHIDVLMSEDSTFSFPEFFGSNVKYILKPATYFRVDSLSLLRNIQNLLKYLPMYLYGTRKYNAIIGVDPRGIALANRFKRWRKQCLVYISFEIIFKDEIFSKSEKKLKMMEMSACEKVTLVLIQDKERARVITEENSLAYKNIFLVPNSPMPQQQEKSDYLRRKLKIPAEKKIVLYCGQLAGWSSRDQIAYMVSQWPEKYVLVIHFRRAIKREKIFDIQHLIKAKKVFISDNPLPNREIIKLICSADYGIAPYKPVYDHWTSGKNIFHMGFSSGKVAFYAMCGLPIIASSLPVYKKEFAKYNCGLVYNRISDIGNLLIELDKNYAFYSRGSKKFYKERLNPIEAMNKFCNRLMSLIDT